MNLFLVIELQAQIGFLFADFLLIRVRIRALETESDVQADWYDLYR